MTEWIVIDENDLDDPRSSGGRIRAKCHLHGGDHQRSLSIDEESGFGSCWQCKRQVLIRDINPEAALNIERGRDRLARGEIRLTKPEHILQKIQRASKPKAATEEERRVVEMLMTLQESMSAALSQERPRSYIEGRGITLDTALSCGVGYVPIKEYRGKWEPLNAWRDHIVFPTWNPDTFQQFSGRKLWLWQPGMDEEEHGALLKKNNLNKYHKTYNNGWFNYDMLSNKESDEAIFCEGPFDSLSLLEGGFLAVSIVGTALEASWIPKHIKRVTLAFDGDEAGREKAENIRRRVYTRGFEAVTCCPPDDGLGKDWSERYRRFNQLGLYPLFDLAEKIDLSYMEPRPDDPLRAREGLLLFMRRLTTRYPQWEGGLEEVEGGFKMSFYPMEVSA